MPVRININKNLSADQVNSLKDIFDKFPGKSSIEIMYTYDGLKTNISINDFKVNNCKELYEEISKTFALN